jgi:hypothetical protein
MGNVSKNYKWKEYLIFIQVNETWMGIWCRYCHTQMKI